MIFFFIGAVIGLEINGKESISLCNDILDAMFEGKNKSEFVFVFASASKNKRQTEAQMSSV